MGPPTVLGDSVFARSVLLEALAFRNEFSHFEPSRACPPSSLPFPSPQTTTIKLRYEPTYPPLTFSAPPASRNHPEAAKLKFIEIKSVDPPRVLTNALLGPTTDLDSLAHVFLPGSAKALLGKTEEKFNEFRSNQKVLFNLPSTLLQASTPDELCQILATAAKIRPPNAQNQAYGSDGDQELRHKSLLRMHVWLFWVAVLTSREAIGSFIARKSGTAALPFLEWSNTLSVKQEFFSLLKLQRDLEISLKDRVSKFAKSQ